MRIARPLFTLAAGFASVAVLAGPAGPAAAGPAPTAVTAKGIGPLKLGMTRTAAVRTGWLSDRGTGCPLGGKPYPITYALRGAKAPGALRGTAEFERGRLAVLTFSKGVRTDAGVTVGTTTDRMVERYRAVGLEVQLDVSELFDGTFVNVTKGDDDVIGGFAPGNGRRISQIGLPGIPVCE